MTKPTGRKRVVKANLLKQHDYLYGPKVFPIFEQALPMSGNMPTVTLYVKQVKKFRDDYRVLLEFAMLALKKRDFCIMDMLAYLRLL